MAELQGRQPPAGTESGWGRTRKDVPVRRRPRRVPRGGGSGDTGARMASAPKDRSGLRLAARLGAAGLLLASGAIHLDLYLTGYRTIPTIGDLFLLQAAAAFVLGGAVAALGLRLVSAAAALFALATLAGYLLAVRVGLFGFKEVLTTAGVVAGVLEVAAVALLALVVLLPLAGGDTGWAARLPPRGGRTLGGAGVLVAAGMLLAALTGARAAAVSPVRGPAQLLTRTIGGVRVLTDAKGFTLYWFTLDTPRSSRCERSCAALWPPLIGRPVAGPGVSGRLGTIVRPGGARQVTYDGHPLYTYAGDSSPGQANGNGLDVSGGYWHEARASGHKA